MVRLVEEIALKATGGKTLAGSIPVASAKDFMMSRANLSLQEWVLSDEDLESLNEILEKGLAKPKIEIKLAKNVRVAELVDAQDLRSCTFGYEGSTPSLDT